METMVFTYTFGKKKWGGVYWQNKPDNWGHRPGNDYSGEGFTKITFWARGEKGNEVVEFKVRQQNSYTWVVAFPLTVSQPGH